MKKQYRCLLTLIFCSAASVLFYVSLNRKLVIRRPWFHYNLQVQTTDFNVTEHLQQSVINQTKYILLWNPMWGYRFGQTRQPFLNAGCPVSNCYLTTNRKYRQNDSFDAFVIHIPTQRSLWKLPNRNPDQIFVFFSTEPPQHMPSLKSFDGHFNWTMTYLSDSDFHLRYGRIEALPSAPQTEAQRLDVMARIAATTNPAAGKTKLAVWFVSNCNAPSNRMEYVKLLRKYVNVDIFSHKGRCGGKDQCPRKDNADQCYDKMEATYKFYFAFENAICKDYVTEKFFDMMGRNIVPVVLGGVDYASIAPPHSYINALDYKPKDLAEYLKTLDANDTLYAEYFWWKPFYRVKNLIETNRETFCDLCAALHDVPSNRKTATGLQKWYFHQSHCKNRPKFSDD